MEPIKAKFKRQLDVVERGNFKSRQVVVITDYSDQYPQTIQIEVQGDRVDIFNGATEGQEVVIHCNLRGREWTNPDTTKNPEQKPAVFNSIVCWKVEGIGAGAAPAPSQQQAATPAAPTAAGGSLPF